MCSAAASDCSRNGLEKYDLIDFAILIEKLAQTRKFERKWYSFVICFSKEPVFTSTVNVKILWLSYKTATEWQHVLKMNS